jgi:hypothetical protein
MLFMSNAIIVKFLGTDDSVSTCDCCGKRGLKHTVVLETDMGDEVFYGVTCASRALGMAAKDVKSRAVDAQTAKRNAQIAAIEKIRREEDAIFGAWLARQPECVTDWDGRVNRIKTINALGGWTTTREMYNDRLNSAH